MSKRGNGFEKIVKAKYTSRHFVALHISMASQAILADLSNLHRGYIDTCCCCWYAPRTHTHTDRSENDPV